MPDADVVLMKLCDLQELDPGAFSDSIVIIEDAERQIVSAADTISNFDLQQTDLDSVVQTLADSQDKRHARQLLQLVRNIQAYIADFDPMR